MKKRLPLRYTLGLSVIGLGAVILLSQWVHPHTYNILYKHERSTVTALTTLPTIWGNGNEGGLIDVYIPFKLNRTFKTVIVTPDDCFAAMTIDTLKVPLKDPYCGVFTIENQHGILNTGEHTLSVQLLNKGGPTKVNLEVSPGDPWHIALVVVRFLLFCAIGIGLWSYRKLTKRIYWLGVIFMAGSALRLSYFLETNFPERSYDAQGHLDYILYMLTKGAIPPSQGAWEFHQNPLYYTIAAALWRVGKIFGFYDNSMQSAVQGLSLLCTIATLLIGITILHRVFTPKQTVHAILGSVCLAVLPPLIFQSAQITNDVLGMTFGMGAMLILLMLRQDPLRKRWVMLGIVTALAFLTKTTYLFLLPIIAAGILLQPATWKKRAEYGGIVLGIFLLLTSWLGVMRLQEADHTRLATFGTQYMSSKLRVENGLQQYLIFNPGYLVRIPYNSPWEDQFRRNNFWEYLFRSTFFGEFRIRQLEGLAVGIIIYALFILPAMFLACGKELLHLRKKPSIILLVTGAFMAAVFLYRLRFPFSSNQDFRLVPLLALPFAYYMALGMETLPRFAHMMYVIWCSVLLILCFAFVMGLMFI